MSITILEAAQRRELAAVALVFALAALLLRWLRARSGWSVAAASVAVAAAGLLALERAVALVVTLSAPDAVDFNEHRWVVLAPWGRTGLALGAGAVALMLILSWRATRRLRSPWRRALLLWLRAAAAGCALVLFLEPAVELRQVAREPNRVAILVDDSLSMSLREQAGGASRTERARALLDASAGTFAAWRREHDLDFYTFSASLQPSTEAAAAAGLATGRATLMRQALEQLRARYDGLELAGVVVISDGIPTGRFSGEIDAESRDFLRSLDAHVHTAWVGRPGLKDVTVARVLADEIAFVRTVVRVEAVLRTTGYGPRRVPVTLSGEGVELRQKFVDLPAGEGETRVAFEFTPARMGKYVYRVATPVAPDEAVADNNALDFVVRVTRDKTRVLQVAGQPSWDVRALRGMLKQNPNVDLISFFILRTQEDVIQVPEEEMSLIPFPTRELFEEQLPSFDLIVLQNFEYLPYGIGAYLENIRSYVDGGGGLVMLGGRLSFASGGYAGTPLAAALPVTLPTGRTDLLDAARFRPQLTDEGLGHPITALRYQSRDNAAAWQALPPLDGVNRVGDAVPGATVLAVHPNLRTAAGRPMPVIVAGEYGDGRTLAIATDSLWQWGFVAAGAAGDDGRAYLKLWENAIRWLIQDPDLSYLHVESDAPEYAPGAAVRLEIRLYDRDYTPLAGGKVTVALARGADPQATEPVASTELTVDDDGTAVWEAGGLEPGVYRASARAEVAGKPVSAVDIFLVNPSGEELVHPAAGEEILRAIALETGGTYVGAADRLPEDLGLAPPQVTRVDRRADVELWSRPYVLAVALALLALEWVLRRRSGYL